MCRLTENGIIAATVSRSRKRRQRAEIVAARWSQLNSLRCVGLLAQKGILDWKEYSPDHAWESDVWDPSTAFEKFCAWCGEEAENPVGEGAADNASTWADDFGQQTLPISRDELLRIKSFSADFLKQDSGSFNQHCPIRLHDVHGKDNMSDDVTGSSKTPGLNPQASEFFPNIGLQALDVSLSPQVSVTGLSFTVRDTDLGEDPAGRDEIEGLDYGDEDDDVHDSCASLYTEEDLKGDDGEEIFPISEIEEEGDPLYGDLVMNKSDQNLAATLIQKWVRKCRLRHFNVLELLMFSVWSGTYEPFPSLTYRKKVLSHYVALMAQSLSKSEYERCLRLDQKTSWFQRQVTCDGDWDSQIDLIAGMALYHSGRIRQAMDRFESVMHLGGILGDRPLRVNEPLRSYGSQARKAWHMAAGVIARGKPPGPEVDDLSHFQLRLLAKSRERNMQRLLANENAQADGGTT